MKQKVTCNAASNVLCTVWSTSLFSPPWYIAIMISEDRKLESVTLPFITRTAHTYNLISFDSCNITLNLDQMKIYVSWHRPTNLSAAQTRSVPHDLCPCLWETSFSFGDFHLLPLVETTTESGFEFWDQPTWPSRGLFAVHHCVLIQTVLSKIDIQKHVYCTKEQRAVHISKIVGRLHITRK